ncbi:Tetratricopeptide repeat-containing protein [Oceanobacillus limi]|uniref:Tetratricopeptide repeat-containing protein n=1 Tax=Oceanobacillus limi TaxID=930131 RepID=A0A1H9ZGJ9_9BACI|nr:tetratricopeptide repeat protein [Oceanobacillus limi]SES80448.1 Tetratricopeptide repeat-containing protein [Oceanobacillus limi]
MDTIMRALGLMENNQNEEAIELLEQYIPTANEEEKYTIAELFIQWGLLNEAKEILQDLLQNYPDESDLKIMLADIYIEQENDEEAINLLGNIAEDDEAYTQALIQLADLYQAQGLHEVAEQKLLLAKNKNPNEIIIDFALGELYFFIGESNKSITHYEKVAQQTNEVASISIYERLAEAYASVGEYEAALNYYQKEDHENVDTLFKYGITAFQANRKDIAIHVWEKVIEQDSYYHTAYFQLAKAYEEEELIQEAFDTSQKGIKVDEFNKELYFYTGKLAHKLGHDVESESFVRQAIALDVDYKEAVLFLIELLKEKEKHEEIVELVLETKRTGADDPIYEWEVARAYNEIESFKDALNHYKEAYNSLQHDSDFLKEYGYFLVEEGRKKEATQVFDEYLALQPLDETIREYVERLRQL